MKESELFDRSLLSRSENDKFDSQSFLPAVSDLSISAGLPVSVNVDVAKLVGSIANTYRDIEINREQQRTEREKMRQLARIYIAKMEEDTKRYRLNLMVKREERMGIIMEISGLLSAEKLDSEVVNLVKYLLQYLLEDSKNLKYIENNYSQEV